MDHKSFPAASLRLKLATINYAKARLDDHKQLLETHGDRLAIHRKACEALKSVDVESSRECLVGVIDGLLGSLDDSIRSVKVCIGEIDKSAQVCKEMRASSLGSN